MMSFLPLPSRVLAIAVALCLLAVACTTESAQLVPPGSSTTTQPDQAAPTTASPEDEPPATTTPPSDDDADPGTDPGDAPGEGDEPTEEETPEFEAEPPAPIPAEPEPEGLIAMLGNDGDVLIIEPTGTQVAELTDHDDRRNAQPTWSPDGEFVAWTERPTVNSPVPRIAIDTPDADRGASIETPFPSFYNSWSPDAYRIAMLGPSGLGVELAMVGVDDGALSADEIAVDGGQPFFFDWIDAGSAYTHAGPDVRTLTFGEAGPGGANASFSESEQLGLGFGAPDVLEDGTAIVVDESSGTPVLERRALDGSSSTPLANLTDRAFVVVDPTETFIAVQVLGELAAAPPTTVTAFRQPTDPELPTMGGGVWVYELSSGETFQVADEERLGMFWDPSGTRLLMLAPDGDMARWQVWAIDGSSRFTNLAQISPVILQEYLPFYDQFAKNVSFWSPDGSSFVYSAVADDGFLTIFIHNASQNGVSTEVAKGPVAVWSPPGGGGGGAGSRL